MVADIFPIEDQCKGYGRLLFRKCTRREWNEIFKVLRDKKTNLEFCVK